MDYVLILALVAALGSGLVGGVFYAFSTFVMNALARLPAPQGIAAMQSINVVVINPLFLGVFLGMAALCVGAAAFALARWNTPYSAWLLAGAVLYFAGSFVVTMRCNVPLNNALARARAEDEQSVALWQKYLREWTLWNHVRTAASLAAALSFSLALAA